MERDNGTGAGGSWPVSVTVRSIERDEAKASNPREVVSEVKAVIDGRDRALEVSVTIERIGQASVPCAALRDRSEMGIFKHDHRARSDILKSVLGVYNREWTML